MHRKIENVKFCYTHNYYMTRLLIFMVYFKIISNKRIRGISPFSPLKLYFIMYYLFYVVCNVSRAFFVFYAQLALCELVHVCHQETTIDDPPSVHEIVLQPLSQVGHPIGWI